ncbi:MAG: hydroxymethylbilane synthase [Lentisphaerae bacterium]|nr:hydroxymethylbilane synthase [Lentisphaerota bacterium]MCP4101990.1 hydroxymethylbilane synthase [Lentisphaerota bacterium]
MNDSLRVLVAGARNSRLSIAQTKEAVARIQSLVPSLKLEFEPMSSPGDRDKQTDLRVSDPDFFTRDLDKAVLDGKIDCAVHSAKDLPDSLQEGLDLLILPWSEDPRDVLVARKGESVTGNPRTGVSSERRDLYCAERFPQGERLPVRGNIEQRIEQLDAGKYDLLIMAAAGLKRLGLNDRITEYIPLEEMPVPEKQGKIAVTFKSGHPVFTELRKLFVKPVTFAGAGIGTPGSATIDTVNALRHCDICMYDALCPQELLSELPENAQAISVGKRSGAHSVTQPDICRMLVAFARENKALVRLKGGDPGIFGRLSEEVTALNNHALPFKVLPGVSSLSAATTATGLLLTQRDLSRGFLTATPRRAVNGGFEWFSEDEMFNFPKALFMSTGKIAEVVKNLKSEGKANDYPIAIVYAAGSSHVDIICGTLNDITSKLPETKDPGIVLTGIAAKPENLYKNNGAMQGRKVLFAGSKALVVKAEAAVNNLGGKFLPFPMIELTPANDAAESLALTAENDWLLVTSPSCGNIIFKMIDETGFDIRKLPKIAVCGIGTAAVFEQHGIHPEICPDQNFGGQTLLEAMLPEVNSGAKILRLRSDLATSRLAKELEKAGAKVTDKIFYHTQSAHPGELPDFDMAMFTSSSSIEAFVSSYGADILNDKLISVIGAPTAETAQKHLRSVKLLESCECTVNDMALSLAAEYVNEIIEKHLRS